MLDKIREVAGPAAVAGTATTAPWWAAALQQINLQLTTISLVVGITAGLLTIRVQYRKLRRGE